MSIIVMGIDPGVTGGVCMLSKRSKVCLLEPMPTILTGKCQRRGIDILALMIWIEAWEPIMAVLERQWVFPKQGAVSGFTIGLNFGEIRGMFKTLKMSHQSVPPQMWQRAFSIRGKKRGDTKRQARNVVCDLFPMVGTKHDGCIDALLIAEFARRML